MTKQDDRQEQEAGAVRADVALHVRQRLGLPENVRILQAMPQFSLDGDMPDPFGALLSRLDEAERRAD